MTPPTSLADWLVAFDAALVVRPDRRERILVEVEDHLAEAVEARTARGAAVSDAEREAVRQFGEPAEAARRFRPDPGGVAQHRLAAIVDRFDRWRPAHPWLGAALPMGWPPVLLIALAFSPHRGLVLVWGAPMWLSGVLEGWAARARPERGHRAMVAAWRRAEPSRARALTALSLLGAPVALVVVLGSVAEGLAVTAVLVVGVVGLVKWRRRPHAHSDGQRCGAPEELARLRRGLLSGRARLGFFAVAATMAMVTGGGRGPMAATFAAGVVGFEVPRALIGAQLRRRAVTESLARRASASLDPRPLT